MLRRPILWRFAMQMNSHEIWIGLKTCCAVNWTKRPTACKRNIFPLVPRPLPTNLDVCSPCAGPEIVVYKKLFHKLHNSTLHCVQTACFLLECNTNLEIFVTGILQLYSLHNFQILGKNSIIQYQYRPDLYYRDRWSVWTNLGEKKVVRLIIRLFINAGKQSGHPSRQITHASLSD